MRITNLQPDIILVIWHIRGPTHAGPDHLIDKPRDHDHKYRQRLLPPGYQQLTPLSIAPTCTS